MPINNFEVYKDTRGDLLPIEFKDIPFIPKRAFIVKNCYAGCLRGYHAHYKTQQYLICLKGKIKVFIHDGVNPEKVTLLKENQGIFIDNLRWDSQKFITGKDLLLVLCSTPFDFKDYIYDFNQFLEIAKEKNVKYQL